MEEGPGPFTDRKCRLAASLRCGALGNLKMAAAAKLNGTEPGSPIRSPFVSHRKAPPLSGLLGGFTVREGTGPFLPSTPCRLDAGLLQPAGIPRAARRDPWGTV